MVGIVHEHPIPPHHMGNWLDAIFFTEVAQKLFEYDRLMDATSGCIISLEMATSIVIFFLNTASPDSSLQLRLERIVNNCLQFVSLHHDFNIRAELYRFYTRTMYNLSGYLKNRHNGLLPCMWQCVTMIKEIVLGGLEAQGVSGYGNVRLVILPSSHQVYQLLFKIHNNANLAIMAPRPGGSILPQLIMNLHNFPQQTQILQIHHMFQCLKNLPNGRVNKNVAINSDVCRTILLAYPF